MDSRRVFLISVAASVFAGLLLHPILTGNSMNEPNPIITNVWMVLALYFTIHLLLASLLLRHGDKQWSALHIASYFTLGVASWLFIFDVDRIFIIISITISVIVSAFAAYEADMEG